MALILIILLMISGAPLAQAHPCKNLFVFGEQLSLRPFSGNIFVRPLHFKINEPRAGLRNGHQSNLMLRELPANANEYRFAFNPDHSLQHGDLWQVDLLKQDKTLESFQLLLPAGHPELLRQFKYALADIPEDFLSFIDIVRIHQNPFDASMAQSWINPATIRQAQQFSYLVNTFPSHGRPHSIRQERASVLEIFLSADDSAEMKAAAAPAKDPELLRLDPHVLLEAFTFNFLQRAQGASKDTFKEVAEILGLKLHQDKFSRAHLAQYLAKVINQQELSPEQIFFLSHLRPRQTNPAAQIKEEFAPVRILKQDSGDYLAYYRDHQGGHTIDIRLPTRPSYFYARDFDPATDEIFIYHLTKIVERLPHHIRQNVKFVIDMDPYTKRPTAYWSKFPQSTPEIKLHLSTALFQKGHPSLNATQWAKLIEQAIKEEYNEEYLATKNLIIPPKKNFILDSRFQFWAVAKQQALKDRRPPHPDWFALPQIWWPSYHRFFKQAIRVTQEKIYTGRRADGTKVHVPMETRRLMAVGDHARYTMMVSFPKNISPANRNILLTTIQEIFSALPVEIPLTRSIKFLPENIFPYSDFTNPEEHATMAVCNFKGQQNRASSKETVYFDYHEELIIGNFISSSQTLSADKIKQKVWEGLANIINNGLFKDAPQTSLPEEFFTAMIPQYRPSAYRRDDRRKAIKAISYYLEHRFNRNYEPSKHLAYQPLFNFLDKFFIAREKILPEIKQKIHLATARDSKLWEKLPLIYEEQLVPAPQKGQRNFQISLNHPGHIAPIPLQLFDLGDDTIDALDQFRYGVDYFIEKRKLSYEDFLKQLSFIKLTDASAPANAVRLTGKLDRGRPTEIAFTQETIQGRQQITFYLNPDMMHGYVGQVKFLLVQAWQAILDKQNGGTLGNTDN